MIYVSYVSSPSYNSQPTQEKKMPAPPSQTHRHTCHTLLILMGIRSYFGVKIGRVGDVVKECVSTDGREIDWRRC